MDHYIQCIIGPKNVITELSARWILKTLDLKEGFSLIPLTYKLIDDMNELAGKGENLAYKEFKLLNKSIAEVLKVNSFTGPVGYIETNYRKGQGTQVSIAYSKRKIIAGPISSKTNWDEKEMKFVETPKGKGAINIMLYKLGLKERQDLDGFDNLGLGNYKSNERILKII